MCLIVFANNFHPNYKLIFAANRDEFYDRSTKEAEFWKDNPELLAGMDLQAGGTWMGITKQGRFAAITNFRDLKNYKEEAPSRGKITLDFLTNNIQPEEYYNSLKPDLNGFNGFNLIFGTIDELFYFSNKSGGLQKLEPGIHGISNALLNTPWPKVEKVKRQLEVLLKQNEVHPWEVMSILYDTLKAKDENLPDTGVGIELERMLSPVFISSERYGTRCSTVVIVDYDNNVQFVEKTYHSGIGTFSNKEFKFEIES
jgi:uncharacterized protein with NRDE domain